MTRFEVPAFLRQIRSWGWISPPDWSSVRVRLQFPAAGRAFPVSIVPSPCPDTKPEFSSPGDGLCLTWFIRLQRRSMGRKWGGLRECPAASIHRLTLWTAAPPSPEHRLSFCLCISYFWLCFFPSSWGPGLYLWLSHFSHWSWVSGPSCTFNRALALPRDSVRLMQDTNCFSAWGKWLLKVSVPSGPVEGRISLCMSDQLIYYSASFSSPFLIP